MFPQIFKKAVVTPLVKKASLLVKWIVQHINSNIYFNPQQSACKTCHSTETALLHIKNEIHLSLSCGEPTALVCLLHLTLLFLVVFSCLKSCFGVCGMTLKWFTSYLSHQFQAIKIGSILSELCELLFGVPQSSVLCPLLFYLYITPLS